MSILKPFTGFAAFAAVLILAVATDAAAQNIRTERIAFASGTSGSVVQGALKGDEIVDYLLNARAGQRMVVDMSTGNAAAYFNIMPSDSPEAIFIGNVEGGHFDGILPSDGDWVIRVYLMRSAARREEMADYTVSVHVGGAGATAPSGDFADGNSGGPDFWQVSGVSAGDYLNLRSGPGTANPVIARAANGQVFRNLGCQGAGQSRWCHVASRNGAVSGWAARRFLRESGAPSSVSSAPPAETFADGDAGGPDFWQVKDVAADDFLNMRTGPSTGFSIVARVPNGATLRNLGCKRAGDARWCHVATPDGSYDGWVSARYLREGSATAASGPGLHIPSGSAVTPDLYIRPTGEIEVLWSGGCTVLYAPNKSRIQAGISCNAQHLDASDAAVTRLR